MTFSEKLNELIDIIECQAKDISRISGISSAVISRYRTGERIPRYKSEQFESLILALSKIAKNKDIDLTEKEIRNELEKCINKNDIDIDIFRNNLNSLINNLEINAGDLAKYIGFDSSYISKVRNGKRKPQNIEEFSMSIAKYINKYYCDESSFKTISSITNISKNDLNYKFIESINYWLCNNKDIKNDLTYNFLSKLNEFNLDNYIKSIKFNEIKIPSVPFQLSKSKYYYNTEGYKNSQLDTLKCIVLSKNKDDVFFYSNMPILETSEDLEFVKKFMIGIGLMLKKNIHLNMIHNLNRPFHEILLGLEGWIPLYMTGLINPFYIKNSSNDIYYTIDIFSTTAAMHGYGIDMNNSKYYLTNKKDELEFYQNNIALLMKKATPLMQIYSINKKDEYLEYYKNFLLKKINRNNILSTLPIYTMNVELLEKILKRNKINKKTVKEIIDYFNLEKNSMINLLKEEKVTDNFYIMNENEFNNNKICLSLSNLFLENNIYYNYEEYLLHLENTKVFKNKYSNYNYNTLDNMVFNNINIYSNENIAIISKNNNPTIHFVINHQKLVNAIYNFKVTMKED